MITTRGTEKIELQYVDSAAAGGLGVSEGEVPASIEAGQRRLLDWNHQARWSSPLVFAGEVEIFDFTKGYDPDRLLTCAYGIGRYDEDRVGMYETALFTGGPEPRTIHMGIDIGAASGTPIFAPVKGVIFGVEHRADDGDYGGTVILKSDCSTPELYMLFGHLSMATVRRLSVGEPVEQGALLGWLGEKHENGGWNSHLHWQLSWLKPRATDLPGAVSQSTRRLAQTIFPDPTPLLRTALAGWS